MPRCYAPTMHSLALGLNALLDNHIMGRALSIVGRRMYFPKGIVAQSAEAGERAHRFNATVGLARSGKQPLVLPSMQRMLDPLPPADTVAYSGTAGVARLRDSWGAALRRKNPSLGQTPTSRPVVVPGLTNGLFQVGSLFLDPGDTVIIPDLFWGNYRLMLAERLGARIVTFPLFSGGGFNTAGLEAALEAVPGKAMVLLNFPNNPTGYALTTHERPALVEVFRRRGESGRDTLVVSDDAYFSFFFEPECETESIFAHLANLHERVLAIKVDGATKEEFAWGLRVGFVTLAHKGANAEVYGAVEKKLMGAIRSSISNSSTLGQTLILRLLESAGYEREHAELFEAMKARYREVRRILAEVLPSHRAARLLEPLPCNAGYFVALACRGISAEALRVRLLDVGVGIIAVADELVRVSFAGVDHDELEACFSVIFDEAEALGNSA